MKQNKKIMKERKKPLIIGLTGGIGSGKSACSRILSENFGLPIVDADAIAYKVCEPDGEGLKAIIENFGEDYLLEDGKYNRVLMRETVTEDPEALKELNAILHPIIRAEKKKAFESLSEAEIIIYDCPLLFEAGEDEEVDEILLITAEEEIRLKRIMQRDQINREQAKQRIAIQMPEEQKISRADTIIYNNGSLEDLERALAYFLSDKSRYFLRKKEK